MPSLAPFGVEAWLNRWEKTARYDIAQSTIASLTAAELFQLTGDDQAAFFAHLAETPLNYGWIEGSPEFKTAVARIYDHVAPENVLQTNGATGANLMVLTGLVQPGDHVIAEYPSYQQLYDLPRFLGARVDYWQLHEEGGWYPSLAELAALVTPQTKLICLNNANNPTGTYLDRDFLTGVIKIARRVNAYVLVDEVYQPLAEGTEFTSIVDLYEQGIATNSLSKTYSVPGLRIGWAVANAELTARFREVRDYTMICGGIYNDALATYVLNHRNQVLDRNRRLVRANLATYQDWLEHEDRVSVVMPAGVSTSFPRLVIEEDVRDFCQGLLKHKGVLLVPGDAFGVANHVRLGYCAPAPVLESGLTRLAEYLHRND